MRAAIQMAVAGTLAIIVGDAVSAPDFFWAVLTVFLFFFGPVNAAEQVSRSVVRFLATAVGILAVLAVVHVFGSHDAGAVAIVVLSSLLGFYLMRVNAGFMLFVLTVAVSQLYVQLHQHSGDLLRLGVEEAGVGAPSVLGLTTAGQHALDDAATSIRERLYGQLRDWTDRDIAALARLLARFNDLTDRGLVQ